MIFKIKCKYFLAGLICFGLLLLPALPVEAAVSYDLSIVVNNKPAAIPAGDQPAFAMNGRTYVPLRVVGESLGTKVDWVQATRQVVITTPRYTAGTIPGRSGSLKDIEIVIDGKVLNIPPDLGHPFVTKRNRVVIPLRAVGEALGCQVSYNASRQVEIISQPWFPEPGRGEVEGPDTDPSSGAPQTSALLQELAGYRTNLKLLDGRVINSAELANCDAGSLSEEQLQRFEQYRQELAKYDLQVQLPDGTVRATRDLEIMGPAIASAGQLKAWIAADTPRIRAKMEQRQRPFLEIPDYLIDLYLTIGAEYGVRGDLAFCQAVKETEYFQFTGSVQPFQNNYCGLWAVGSPCTGQESLNGADASLVYFQPGVHGAIFTSPEAGVEAHIQHLYAYACKEPLPAGKVLCDPRFKLVQRGSAPTWQGLNARWAVPGVTYGQSIIHDYWKKAVAN